MVSILKRLLRDSGNHTAKGYLIAPNAMPFNAYGFKLAPGVKVKQLSHQKAKLETFNGEILYENCILAVR